MTVLMVSINLRFKFLQKLIIKCLNPIKYSLYKIIFKLVLHFQTNNSNNYLLKMKINLKHYKLLTQLFSKIIPYN